MLVFDYNKLLLVELNSSLSTSYTEAQVTWSDPVSTEFLPGGTTAFTYNTGIIATVNATDYFLNYNRVSISGLLSGKIAAYGKLRMLNVNTDLAASIALSLVKGYGFPITASDIDPTSVMLTSDGLNIRFRTVETSKQYLPQWHTVPLKAYTIINGGKFYTQADISNISHSMWYQDMVALGTSYTAYADTAAITGRCDYTPARGVLKHLKMFDANVVAGNLSDLKLLERLRQALTQVDGNPWVVNTSTTKVAWNLAGAKCIYTGPIANLTPSLSMSRSTTAKQLLALIKPANAGYTHITIMRLSGPSNTEVSMGISNMHSDCALFHYNA